MWVKCHIKGCIRRIFNLQTKMNGMSTNYNIKTLNVMAWAHLLAIRGALCYFGLWVLCFFFSPLSLSFVLLLTWMLAVATRVIFLQWGSGGLLLCLADAPAQACLRVCLRVRPWLAVRLLLLVSFLLLEAQGRHALHVTGGSFSFIPSFRSPLHFFMCLLSFCLDVKTMSRHLQHP